MSLAQSCVKDIDDIPLQSCLAERDTVLASPNSNELVDDIIAADENRAADATSLACSLEQVKNSCTVLRF